MAVAGPPHIQRVNKELPHWHTYRLNTNYTTIRLNLGFFSHKSTSTLQYTRDYTWGFPQHDSYIQYALAHSVTINSPLKQHYSVPICPYRLSIFSHTHSSSLSFLIYTVHHQKLHMINTEEYFMYTYSHVLSKMVFFFREKEYFLALFAQLLPFDAPIALQLQLIRDKNCLTWRGLCLSGCDLAWCQNDVEVC